MALKKPPKEVENEEIFKEFCSNRELAPRSITLYANILQMYSDFTGLTLEELIDEAEDEEDLNVRYRRRKINKYLNDFKQHIEDYSYNYKQQIMTSVKAFYNEYDIQLPRSRRAKSRKSKPPETIADLPTMDEIRKFIEHCNTTYKAIVTLGLSSGMSRAELSNLTFKHFYDAIPLEKYPNDIHELIEKTKEKGDFVPFWNITRIKTGKKYFTFSSPESVDRILDYLEELNFKNPDFIPNPEDYFLRNTSSNKHINADNMGALLPYINRVNGFRQVNGRYVVRCHTLRKYFATTLERNKVPHLTTRWLLGHSIDNTTSAYFKADPESVKEDYLDVIDELSIKEVEVKTITTDGYDKLLEKIEKLEADNKKYDRLQSLIEKLNLDPEYLEKVRSMKKQH